MEISGRSVIVAGASGGLGAPIASLLVAAGAIVTPVSRRHGHDLRKAGVAARVVEETLERVGAVDGVVFAAGVVAFGPVADTPDEVLIDLFTTNTLAPIRLLRAALPALRQSASAGREPFVVNISAVVAEQPLPGMAAYSASKASLTAYDAAAARELRREGVRVIDARPPHTETGLATRPILGVAPSLPEGLSPDAVAARIVAAIVAGEKDLPSTAFA